MMQFGLSEEILWAMKDVIRKFSAVEQALIYGSRARGDYRPGSDIDLAIIDSHPVMTSCFAAVSKERHRLNKLISEVYKILYF